MDSDAILTAVNAVESITNPPHTPERSSYRARKTVEQIVHLIFLLCGIVAVAFVLLISIYLILSGLPAIRQIGLFQFLLGKVWDPTNTTTGAQYGILPFILTSVYGTAGAIVIGVPVGLLTAVFLAKVAPPKLAAVIRTAVQLLAGIPSVVYGLVGMIVLVALILVFGFSDAGATASVSNIWAHGGLFPNGATSALMAFQIVMFAFIGVEMVGQTASESANPKQVLPRAINAVMWRILIFYVGALAALTALVPWTQFSAEGSPFVQAFAMVGIPAAAGVINFVVTTAALSSCNSGIYSTGRMLRTLSEDGHAPGGVAVLSGRAVPARAIGVTFCVMLIGVALNYLVPEEAFTYITSASTVGALFTWGMILIAHLGFRRKVARGELEAPAFRMPLAPYSNYVVLAFLAMVVVLLAFDSETRIALYITPVLVVLAVLGYQLSVRTQRRRGDERTPVA